MPEKKWLWIDIKAPDQKPEKENLLLRIHADVISKFRASVDSWHFLWEADSFPHTLLIRFYGNADITQEIEEDIITLLESAKIESKIRPYEGEASSFGSTGWEYVMKVLHLGAEFAIAIIENERKSQKSEELKWSLSGYIDRWIHLFMNQLSTRVNEARTLFQLSVHRYAINMMSENQYRAIAPHLDEAIEPIWKHLHDETINPLLKRLVEAQ